MHIARTRSDLRERSHDWRIAGERIAFVPTMGNLHAGHLALVEAARGKAERVAVSIFVNPTQFGPNEDFERYPRTETEDAARLAKAGVDLLFMPGVDEMYPGGTGETTFVEVPGLSDQLCGARRPGHFRGVATIVARLFNSVQPDIALFGEKGYQQLLVIRRMVRDLAFPVEVIGVPTSREKDGLALSSRNQYLSETERALAPQLNATLRTVADRIHEGEKDFAALERDAMSRLERSGFAPEYIAIRRVADLEPPTPGDALVILVAAHLGRTRLIDNLRV
ncbi:MAG: pantoate--beta-alanine ligase [Proteobacteria bacterium]|nr:pantoate--beta-alanine ligase [Pseudomonadota bacterium]